MSRVHGFKLIQEQQIPELKTTAKLYRHAKTGAELLSLENDDENKVFGVTFRTPPPNSTGLPHIMEHSVLCGSRKYPVKEPFVELVKGSLNTFLNAMTYSDKTCYPVASTNLQDFYNLIDVYLDAVFYPRLTQEILEQEGWHYEIEALDVPLAYKGVVFNEMKGVYASPDSLVGRFSEQSLFPDTIYRYDSGGDPEIIPELTWEQFQDFHATYYHPSNARIFFYGDDDPEARLRMVNEYLQDFEALDVDSEIGLQARFKEPRHVTRRYPAGDEQSPKAMVTMNWLLRENNDATETLALNVLSHILLGTPASPLRKALIDSGLGEDVIGGGLDDSLRQLTFSAGLKGVELDNTDQVEGLILSTLERLSEDGIDPKTIAASMNTIEFRLREQNTGRYPRGLLLMIRSLTRWLHEGDPLDPIAFEAPLREVKARLAEDPRYFEGLISEFFLDNDHRTTLVLEPDARLQEEQSEAERARLAAVKAKLTEQEQLALVEHTRYLKTLQEAPDAPEALATIPSLALDDIDESPTEVPTEIMTHHGGQVLFHDLFTNGIVYLDVGMNLHLLPQELLSYATLFSSALLEMGTETQDFVTLMQRIGQTTGGISPTLFTSTVRETGDAAAWSFLRGKATVDQVDELLAILRDILLTVKLDNRPRFVQMLLEKKAKEEAQLVPRGHVVVASRLRAKFNHCHWASEQTGGLAYLFFLRKLVEEVEQDWPSVLEKLETVRRLLVNRTAMVVNATLDGADWTEVEPKLAGFIGALPAEEAEVAFWDPALSRASEALTLPANINYVGKGADLLELGYQLDGSTEVVAHYLRSTWLWEQVRVQGGAYGGFCVFDPHSGAFGYISYRDPNVLQTLAVYDRTPEFLRTVELSQDELVKGIIGTIGNIDPYQLPDAKGYSAMARHLIGYSDEERQAYRSEVLGTTVQDFRAFAETLEHVAESGAVVVLGSPGAVAEAEAKGALDFNVTKVL